MGDDAGMSGRKGSTGPPAATQCNPKGVRSMKFYHKIRNKLLFGFILMAVLPTVVIGIYSVNVSSASLLTQELNSQKQAVASQFRNIRSFLSSTRSDVEFLAESTPVRHYLRSRQTDRQGKSNDPLRIAVEQEFLAFAKSRKIYYQLRYIDETGQEIVRIDTDSAGTSVPVQPDKLQNQANRYYFSETVKLPAGSVFVSPLDLNRERGEIEKPNKPVIRYGIPLRYPDGENAGILITNIYAAGFLSTLDRVMLVDGDGYYLSHPNPVKAWGSKRDLGHGANLKTDFADNAPKIINGAKEGAIITADKVITHMSIPVPGSREEWVLVLDQPVDLLLTSVRKFQTTFWGILAAALAAAIGLAVYIDSRITRPIELLTDRAEKVSMGELLDEVRIDDKGEIGQLADAFERMRVSMVRMIELVRRNDS